VVGLARSYDPEGYTGSPMPDRSKVMTQTGPAGWGMVTDRNSLRGQSYLGVVPIPL